MAEEKVRFAVVGVGGVGRWHAERLHAARNAALVGICDVDAERLQQVGDRLGVSWRTTSYEEVLACEDVEAVVVALPNYLHAPVSVAALRAGKHVLCEKPMARTLSEAEEMAAASRQSGRKLMVHFNYRFTPAAMALHEVTQSGRLGQVYHARSWWHRTRGIPGLGGWFTRKECSGGGPLVDLGVHRLDLALWLMGYPRPAAVTAATHNYLGKAIAARAGAEFDVEDMATAFIRFADGATLVLEASWAANGELPEEMWTQVYGTQAGIIHRNVAGRYEFEALLFAEQGGHYGPAPLTLPPAVETPQEHFARCLIEGREPLVTLEQALTTMRIIDAAYRSAERRQEVHL